MPRRVRGKGRKHFLRARRPAPPRGVRHLQKLHVKKDDLVEVLSGVDKGKRGKVLRAIPAEGMVVVEGVNRKWKHLRRSQENPQGGRVQREMPIYACKVKKVD
ncbi:MAG: 50S ribosomal protein L24 [Planctomycetota bacterium]|nr:MAG: 50S ribosomal protein L24 [Planctomycetota bacterium]